MKNRAYLQLTQSCNLKCKMCNFWLNEKEKLPDDQFIKLINIFITNNIKGITFWGGEPFLNKQIYDLIVYSKKNGLNTEIITNGLLLNKEKIKEIILSLDEIIISIDSGISHVHEKIRGKNNIFSIIISNLEYLVYLRDNFNPYLKINIDLTLQKDNFNNFETILEILKKYNIQLNLDPVQILGYGNNIEGNKLLLNDDEINLLEDKLINFKKNNPAYILQSLDSIKRIIKYFKGYKLDNICKSLNFDLLVNPYGDVLKCWGNGEILYNIFENGLINQEKLKMDQRCYSCGFSHVRDEDYFSGYSITNDLFNDY